MIIIISLADQNDDTLARKIYLCHQQFLSLAKFGLNTLFPS